MGFLYEEHGQHVFFGEPLELLRKLLLSSLPLFFDRGSPVQLLYALVVSFGAALLHASLKPFKHLRRAYFLQHASLVATFSLFAMGLVYQTGGLDTESAAFEALTYLLLSMQALFVVGGTALIVHTVVTGITDALRKRELRSVFVGAFAGVTAATRLRSRDGAHSAPSGNASGSQAAQGVGQGPSNTWRDNPMHSRRSDVGAVTREVELSTLSGSA
mmetsp:Transcript_47848/g.114975  ORF Transcript_47848/g.114975 Transcript_47848/m.114975 type:complete len:216 (+) Transcript_47848:511-1158(+)